LAEVPDQLGGKIRPLRKEFGPLVVFTLFKAFVLYTKIILVYVSGKSIKVNKVVKIHFLEV
jgi:hypothetical protein